MHETIFVKRPKFLAATSNLRVEQNLMHLGRFLHFSQTVVGETLKLRLHHAVSFSAKKIKIMPFSILKVMGDSFTIS